MQYDNTNSQCSSKIINGRVNIEEPDLSVKFSMIDKIPVNMTNLIIFKNYSINRYLELTNGIRAKTEEVLSLLNSKLKND